LRLERRIPKKYFFWLGWHVLLTIFWCAFVLPSCLDGATRDFGDDLIEPLPEHTLKHHAFIEEHLKQGFDGYETHEAVHENFEVIVLSNMAYGMMNIVTADPARSSALEGPIREVVDRALDPRTSPYKKHPEEVKSFGDYNLYLSHVNITLGVYRHITSDTRYDDLHKRISKHLRKKSLADGDAHARSYPVPAHKKDNDKAYKWPADQSALLASLYLYDMTRNGKLSAKPIHRWLRYMSKDDMIAEKHGGLPKSALDDRVGYAKFPRGCALSWMVFYMAQFAPKEANELYEKYREHQSAELLGVGGFREWPEGVSRGMDGDSGPIIFGVGMAATGIGLGPARLMRDNRQYTLIMRSASTFGIPTKVLPTRRYVTAPILGEAMLYSGSTARRWFGEPARKEPFADTAPMASGVYILLMILAALIFYSLASIKENLQEIRRWM